MRLAHPALTLSILLAAALLAAFHWFATINFLYWQYVWLDTLSHFLGGLVSGLIVLRFLRTLPGVTTAWLFFLLVAAIGIGWETFEYFVGSQREANYLFDTSIDVAMDMLGGLSAWFCFGRSTVRR